MIKKILAAIALGILPAASAFAQILPAPSGSNDGNSYNGPLVNAVSGLAYSTVAVMDLAKYDASKVSVQVVYSSINFTSPTVTDGSESSGTVTVAAYTALSSAAATNQITVTTNAFGSLPTITVQNCVLTMGSQFQRGTSAALTAANLATAIHSCVPAIAASATGSIVYATATYGSYANSYAFVSNNSSMTVANPTMTGGKDNACLTINGTALCANSQWSAVTSSVTTAANIVTAINTSLSSVLVATSNFNTASAYGKLTIASLYNGTAYNYTIVSSTPTALTVKDGGNLIGGTNSGFTLNSTKITATGTTGLVLALPVLYAIGSNPAIAGLTTGTTYYAVPASSTQFYLSKYSTSALAGFSADYAVATSTNSSATAHTYTLVPLRWSGSSTFIWQASNDNSNWATALSTGTVTVTSNTTATDSLVDFGVFNFRYLRFNFTAPTSGALNIVVPVNIKQDGIGRF